MLSWIRVRGRVVEVEPRRLGFERGAARANAVGGAMLKLSESDARYTMRREIQSNEMRVARYAMRGSL